MEYVAASYLEPKDYISLESNSIQNNESIDGACQPSLPTSCNYTSI